MLTEKQLGGYKGACRYQKALVVEEEDFDKATASLIARHWLLV